MNTRGGEHNRSTSTYRQALCSAMSQVLTAPFFRRWRGWTIGPVVPVRFDGRFGTWSFNRC